MDVAPNQTLYVQNVVEKLKKDELKKILYALFGQCGKVIDVVVMKTEKLRGQAWIVFADITSATNALRMLNEFPLYGKPLRIQYAKTKSDAVAKMDGSWAKNKRERVVDETHEAAASISRREGAKPAGEPKGAAATGRVAKEDVGEENNILFIENLPEATTVDMLAILFKQFPGFQEARLVPAKPGIAFVEFESSMQSSIALAGLQGFRITPQHSMKVSYAKR